jgi:uncharacterized protein
MLTEEGVKARYPADPVHGFDHVLRVTRLALRLAEAEGADREIVWAAALLHDVPVPAAEGRADHHLASAQLAAELLAAEGWPPARIAAVRHCIEAHRYRDQRIPPQSPEAQVLFDADKLDALGAIGVARVIAYAVQAGQPIYVEPSAQFLATGELGPDEPHSAYHEYLFKLRKLEARLFTHSARRLGAERHAYLAAYFSRLQQEIAGEDGKLTV